MYGYSVVQTTRQVCEMNKHFDSALAECGRRWDAETTCCTWCGAFWRIPWFPLAKLHLPYCWTVQMWVGMSAWHRSALYRSSGSSSCSDVGEWSPGKWHRICPHESEHDKLVLWASALFRVRLRWPFSRWKRVWAASLCRSATRAEAFVTEDSWWYSGAKKYLSWSVMHSYNATSIVDKGETSVASTAWQHPNCPDTLLGNWFVCHSLQKAKIWHEKLQRVPT